MTRTICFANNKGGSCKSTTCSNVGYALSAMGKKVLLIDGARQVGKTYIIRHVGKKLFENFIEINMVIL